MKIERYPTPHYTVGRAGQKVKAIMVHVVEGTYEGCISWFLMEASKVSYHFVLARDGRIAQFVDTENQAWHAGGLNNPRLEYTQFHGHQPPNPITIGIAYEGFSGDYITEAQKQNYVQLVIKLVKQYNLGELEFGRNILEHASVNPVDRGRCPGIGVHITDDIILPVNKKIQMEKLEKQINELQKQLLNINIEREKYHKLYTEERQKYHKLYADYEKLYNEKLAKKMQKEQKSKTEDFTNRVKKIIDTLKTVSLFFKK